MRIAIFTLLASTLFAQKADFSGTWVMNKAQSDFGQMPEQMVPEKLSMKISSTATEFKSSSTQTGARGESTADAVYKLDGTTENINKAMGGEMKTIAKWAGDDTIVMNSAREVQGMSLTIEQQFKKTGADVMLVTTKIGGTPMGEIVMKYQMDRVTGATATGAAAPAAGAKAAVSFAGAWKLNRSKSNFGQLPEDYQPSAMTRVITHDEKLAEVRSVQSGAQGETKTNLKIKLDGSESVNEMMGAQVKSVAKWDGKAVLVNTKRDVEGMNLDITEKWVRVDDKTMNVEMKIGGTPLGELVMTYVFEREDK